MTKEKILIVDDSEMNRAILADMLSDQYEILEAEDGVQAVAALQKLGGSISLVLLDIVMPRMDGFGVLNVMGRNGWIEEIPVIMVSAENRADQIQRAYEMGVTDFIMRPFDVFIVRHRVVNTLLLYAKQKELAGMVEQQIYEKEQRSNLMIHILSHIVEFRNGESGLHILNVRTLTEFLLRELRRRSDRYPLTDEEISDISIASALHDIGKIAIDEKILNKPGRLTDEEFAVMKTHSTIGAQMLQDIPIQGDGKQLVQLACRICRWHHERWDGRGYPDGLKGDEIPIEAQIVAMADVYDALTSERVYKPPFSHDRAVEMITGGECGAFNPLALECLRERAEDLRSALRANMEGDSVLQQAFGGSEVLKQAAGIGMSARTLQLLDYERMKYTFFAAMTEEIQFEYSEPASMLKLSSWGAKKLGLDEIIMEPEKDEALQNVLGDGGWAQLSAMIRATCPESPEICCEKQIMCAGQPRWHRIIIRAVWSSDAPPRYQGALGKAVDIESNHAEKEQLKQKASHDPLTGLLNREAARIRIEQRRQRHPDGQFVLVCFDLDDFKTANDVYGHQFGDRVLREISRRAEHSVREGDIAARIGGDEFLLFLECSADAHPIIERIFHSLCGGFEGYPITVSMGIASSAGEGSEYEELFRMADQAMYAAKRGGRAQYRFYGPSMANVLADSCMETPPDGETGRRR